MAIGSGLGAQLGFATEVTYGTFVTPTRFLEFQNDTMAYDKQRIESSALRAGNRVLRTDRWAQNLKGAAGDLSFDGIADSGFGLLWQYCFGAAPTIDTNAIPSGVLSAAKHMTFSLTDPTSMFFTTQIGTPDVTGTVRARNYKGCKVTSWELSQAIDQLVQLKVSLDAQDEDTSNALASVSYPATQHIYDYTQLAVTVGGVATKVTNFDLKVDTGLATTRYFLRGSTLKAEPIPNAMAVVSGQLDMEFESLTMYQEFTTGSLQAIVATWTGVALPGADSAKNNIMQVTIPQARFDGTTPNVTGPDIVKVSLPFKGLFDGTVTPVKLELQTADTAA